MWELVVRIVDIGGLSEINEIICNYENKVQTVMVNKSTDINNSNN
jgi:hypothetical protein